MSGWDANGLQVATCLLEAAMWRRSIKPTCKCGHSASFNPHGLWWHFERRGWDDSLRAVRHRLWCTMCRSNDRQKRKPAKIELISTSRQDIILPFPPDDVWKRLVRRMR